MEIKIIKDEKNPFFERKEIEFIIKQKDSTPSKEEMEKVLANKTKSKVECVVVEHIYQRFGKLESYGIAKIYNKPVEKKVKKKKEKKPKEEKPEEKKEEVPEEKKEEVKEEAKPEEIPKEESPKKEEKKDEQKEEINEKGIQNGKKTS